MFIKEIIQNIALLIVLLFVFMQVCRFFSGKALKHRIIEGLIFGGMSIATMMFPISFSPGVIIDVRSVIISASGFIGGPVSAVVTSLIASAYRISIGGVGLFAGLLTIFNTALVGVLFNWYFKRNKITPGFLNFLFFGVVTQLVSIPTMFFLPSDVRMVALKNAALYMLIIYPFISMFLMKSFFSQKKFFATERALQESERNYREIVELATQGIWSIDEENKTRFVNTSMAKMLGYLPEEILGRPLFDFMDEEGVRISKKNIERRRKGITEQHDFEFIKKDGRRIYTTIETTPVIDENGNYNGALAGVIDITERKQAEMALQKSENLLSQAEEIANMGSWEWDIAKDKAYWSNGLFKIFRRDPADDAPNWAEHSKLYVAEDFEQYRSVVKECVKHRTPYTFELRAIRSDGEIRHCLARGQAERASDGTTQRLWGTLQDITEKKQIEETLRQSQKMEAIGTMAGGIAHEFNNMLGIIIGNTELAIDDIPDWNPAKDCLKEIKTASLRAKDVVRKLLSVARKTPQSRNPIQISTIIKESLDLIRRTIPTTIDIRKSIACSTELILGDPTEINQVIINLCTNSVHAMPEEHGVLEVSLDIKQLSRESTVLYEDLAPGDYVRLTIKDTGEGIEPAFMGRVFDPYFTTKDVDQGLGMGLAVVHGIVKKHDGAIKIKSEVGKGTAVEVLFPLIEGQAETRTEQIETLQKGAERILLVDDEPSLVKMIVQMLSRSGYKVTGETSSSSALKTFRETPEQFDLVISDIAMPEMAGDRLAKEIKQIRPEVPILLCTGHSDRMDENKALEMGVNAFVTKPLTKSDLTQTVRKVLDEAKIQEQR